MHLDELELVHVDACITIFTSLSREQLFLRLPHTCGVGTCRLQYTARHSCLDPRIGTNIYIYICTQYMLPNKIGTRAIFFGSMA